MQLDVFTNRLHGGNQLAVFLDGSRLVTSSMQSIARELNYSETTFVLPPERPDTDVRMRIFTPTGELPIAGHPTIGSAFALAHGGVIAPGRDQFVFGLGVGPVKVALTWKGNDLSFVWMAQLLPSFFPPSVNASACVAAALSLPEAAVTGTGLSPQVVSCGVPFLIVPVTTRAAVDSAKLNFTAYDELMRMVPGSVDGLFFFSAEPGGDNANAYSRMFAPDFGIFEDPATGIASGPLGCYLVRHNLVTPLQAGALISIQGVKMGRPSEVHISIGVEGNDIRSVRVGGESVLAGEGTLYIP